MRFLTLEDVASGVKSKAFVMSIESIDSRWHPEGGLKQVYDANIDKWLSMKSHKEEVEAFWKSVSGADTAEHYIKHYYSNLLDNFYRDKDDRVNKYVCFFIAPSTGWDDTEEVCGICNNIGYVRCECQDDELRDCDGNDYLFCYICDDASVV